ncbi:MAG: eukaryotic-like serine/threonine-protein kinase [Solirubrobacteraceae bacterium]|nr:eukaryotic-like serine/threonine-protein kinase [Solirubrobacteraceae bacterium]
MGRYRLGRRLGAGGFGAVHEARDEILDRVVAVKVIPGDGSVPVRARREAIAAARLEHPGIVAIYDAGEQDGDRYLVSELVEGRTLAQLAVEEELSDRDVLRIGLALCDALEHAHERGVVHRDVKPQNVLVPDHPRTWRGAAKLADFGVAMLAGDDPLTVTGDVVGTLAYMAPEQAAGKKVDARADLYSLALVVYEGLAGTNPVRGASPAETARKVGNAVPSLGRQRADLPPELIAALDRALSVAPAQRGTLEELGDALEDGLVEVADERGAVMPRHPAERTVWLPGVPRGAPRVAHALATAAVTAATFGWLGPTSAVPWAPAAAVAGALVLVLPRVGWILTALGLMVGLFAGPAAFDADGVSAAGTAVVVLVAAAPVIPLLLSAPRLWSVPVLAPALGAVGLAGVFPALAGRARHWLDRAALGALGAWWLLLAEPLVDQRLLLGPAPHAPAGAEPREAITMAAQGIGNMVTAGLVLLVVIWALAAVLLPWVVRGRALLLDIVAATVWTVALTSATATLATALKLPEPRGLIAAAVVAATVAIIEPRYWSDDADVLDADDV